MEYTSSTRGVEIQPRSCNVHTWGSTYTVYTPFTESHRVESKPVEVKPNDGRYHSRSQRGGQSGHGRPGFAMKKRIVPVSKSHNILS